MAPDAFVPDPNSPEAEAQRRAGLQSQIDSLKRSSQIMAPGYAKSTANQLGIGFPGVDLTGLSQTVVVGTRRLIRITGFVSFSMQGGGATAYLYIKEGATFLGDAAMSRAAGEYGTLVATAIAIGPSPGTHTYKLNAESNPANTIDVYASASIPNWLLIEDIGLAPA